jgi:UDP-glucose 4-epimerase
VRIKGGRFLVIGGAGFIGSHVVDELLAQGAAQVRVYDNFSRGSQENLHSALLDPRCEIFSHGGDILHIDTLKHAMGGIDGVFHLAALWLLQCYEYPRSAFDVNVAGTMNVVEAAIATGIKKLVFSSSASVYGDAVSEPMEEDHQLNCQEFYGASKVCGEMILKSLCNRNRGGAGALQYVGLRYMNVYGPRQDDKGAYVGVIVRMLNDLDAGRQPIIYGDGSQSYDFVDVRDCAKANILAMQSSYCNRNYNIGTGIKTSITELANLVISMHSKKIAPRYEHSERYFVRNRVGSTALAESEIKFTSTVLLSDGLAHFINWRKMVASKRYANDYLV